MRRLRTVRNVHERTIEAPAKTVGALLDQLASAHDPLWPAPSWPPMRFDRPLGVGADGGHGFVRYHVTAYEPGRRVRFQFLPAGKGHHELTVEPVGPGNCLMRHVLELSQRRRDRPAWLLAIRWAHDTVVEELLDNAERVATGTVRRPSRWSAWVRVINRVLWERPVAVPIPSSAHLARAAFDRTDFVDAWQMRLRPGMPQTPEAWQHVMPGFTQHACQNGELLMGDDAGHLDFRASLLLHDSRVTFTTVVKIHNWRGRLYFAVVRQLHPLVVRTMLRRAHRRIARSTPSAGQRALPTEVPRHAADEHVP
ncbi:DUF2867 domain-containing protein [Streptomyces sp. NPDC046197]|uniref:DUF2867 domain-containing protein n=1 Tax=Streptomyces sp. NPDC046197 TaxID=3154337 RepID=UPI0033F58DC5